MEAQKTPELNGSGVFSILELNLELDDVARADICTVTAMDALGNVDSCEIVLDDDCVGGAFFLTLHAADTACITNLHKLSTLVRAAACNHDRLVIGNELDELLGAGIGTVAAAYALFAVDLCNTVYDVHCAELASVYTVAETDASKAAVLVALSAEQHSCLAVLRSSVVEALECNTVSAGAGNECNHFDCIACGNAHDFADFFSGGGTACNTLVDRCFAFCNRCCIAVTSGIAAAAAVCAGQALADRFLLGVYFNVEYLRCKCEDSTENAAHYAKDDNAFNNNSKIHTFPSLAYVHAAEAHECKSKQACGYEANREAFKALGIIGKLDSLTHGGEENDCEHKAYTAGDTVNYALDEVESILGVEKNNTENCAVSGDKGQVNAQRRVERGYRFLEEHLDELNENSNYENVSNGLQVSKGFAEDIFIYNPADCGRKAHDEYNSQTHADCGVDL